MVVSSIRLPSSLSSLASYRHRFSSFRNSAVSLPFNGVFPSKRLVQACLHSTSANGGAALELPSDQSEIIFVGTGTSEGIPRVSCLTDPLKKCQVCLKAVKPGNKNRRLNTSVLIRYPSSSGRHNILIDAGKFFYHSALRWFPAYGGSQISEEQLHAHAKGTISFAVITIHRNPFDNQHRQYQLKHRERGSPENNDWTGGDDLFRFGQHHLYELACKLRWIRTIDAVIITHSHADAIGGLDDLRDWTNNVQPYIPIYVAKRDFEVMKKTHYYLVDTSVIITGAAVSELQFNIISEEPFFVHGLKITPLPVWHGCGYRSLGFRFGNICYISDVSDIPEETYPLLEHCEVLILDALRLDRSSKTHFGLPRALEEVRKIKPKRTLFTGMMHLMDHEEVNGYLSKFKESEGLDVQLSYDGLHIPVRLA